MQYSTMLLYQLEHKHLKLTAEIVRPISKVNIGDRSYTLVNADGLYKTYEHGLL
jgi:hypothetical protein